MILVQANFETVRKRKVRAIYSHIIVRQNTIWHDIHYC